MIKTLKRQTKALYGLRYYFRIRCTLDMKYDIAHQLDLLYDYMYRRLVDANIKKDGASLKKFLGFAKELRDTWEQAMKIANSKIQERLKWLNRRILMNGTPEGYIQDLSKYLKKRWIVSKHSFVDEGSDRGDKRRRHGRASKSY